jgi:hypothetical protein
VIVVAPALVATLPGSGQAQLNPYLILRGLARHLEAGPASTSRPGSRPWSTARPASCAPQRGTLHARWVNVATQIPTVPEGKFFARGPHAHGVVAAGVAGED